MSSHSVSNNDRTQEVEAAASANISPQDSDASTLGDRLNVIQIDVLELDRDDAMALEAESGLFGHLPELDSMAVA